MSTAAGAAEKELERLRAMFEQAPGAMALLRGPEHVFEMANAAYQKLVGHRNVVGRPVAEALPEVVQQGFIDLLDRVYRSGEAHVGKAVPVALRRGMQTAFEERVLDFVYQPLKDGAGRVTGIFVDAADVTERTHAEAALLASEERLQSLFDQTLSGIAETDLSGRFLRVNRRYCEITGRAEADLLAVRIQDITHADDLPRNLELLGPLLRGEGTGFEIEKRYVRPDGSSVWVHNSVALVRDAQGRAQSIAGTTIDITETRAGGAALAQQRRLYEAILTNTPDLAYIFDLDHRFIYANEGLLRMWGKSWDEAIGKNCLELGYEPWHAAMHDREIEQVIATKQPVRGEVPFSGTFGRRIYDYLLVPVIGANDEVEAVAGTTRDVTHHKRIEAELRQSEARFRRLIETSPVGIAISEPDGSVLLANDALLAILGYTRADLELEPLDWHRFTAPEYLPLDMAFIDELRRGGTPSPFEKELIRRDGSRVWVLIVARFLPSEGERMVAYALDITERKQAEDALLNADRRKDEFLATLAHELRNPLAPIRNAVHLLKSDGREPQGRTARDIIERQVQHMVRLVDDLLEVSRITLGQVNLQHEPLNLGQVLRDALDAVAPLIEEAGHELAVHLPAEPLRLDGDTTRLSQVFQNLLDNACKYTPRGGRIVLRAERVGGDAVVSVRDTGVGVPKEMQPRIFELFTRIHPVDRIKTSGLGIGLSLSKRLVELHGGRIEIASEGTGHGSELRVHLPIPEPTESPVPPSANRPAASAAGRDRRVLVVDDNRDSADSLAMLLHLAGSTVAVAHDGPQALEKLQGFRPDVVLLDIGMPGMDGYEVARQMRANPLGKDVRLVALTGWGQADDKRRALEAGFDEHVTKPVDPALLSALLTI